MHPPAGVLYNEDSAGVAPCKPLAWSVGGLQRSSQPHLFTKESRMPDQTAGTQPESESEFEYIEENEPQPAPPMTPEELAALPPPEDRPSEQVPVPAEAPEGWEPPTQYGLVQSIEGDPPGQPQAVPHQESLDGSPSTVELFQRNPRVEGDETISAGLHYGTINFQHGPIQEVGVNGGTIEGVIKVLQERLEGFQRGPFKCVENAQAIRGFQEVLNVLALRTRRRKEQGVEGTNQPHESSAPLPHSERL